MSDEKQINISFKIPEAMHQDFIQILNLEGMKINEYLIKQIRKAIDDNKEYLEEIEAVKNKYR